MSALRRSREGPVGGIIYSSGTLEMMSISGNRVVFEQNVVNLRGEIICAVVTTLGYTG